MNSQERERIIKFLIDSYELFHGEIKTDENKDYRRGYYAGRLHAALSIKNMLDNNEGIDVMRVDFE